MAATRVDQTYIASIEGRGLDHAGKRAELGDQLFDLADDLTRKLEALRELLVGTCDGSILDHHDPQEIGPAEVAFSQAVERFDAGARQAVGFLLQEGGYTVEQISSDAVVQS